MHLIIQNLEIKIYVV